MNETPFEEAYPELLDRFEGAVRTIEDVCLEADSPNGEPLLSAEAVLGGFYPFPGGRIITFKVEAVITDHNVLPKEQKVN